MKVEVKDLAGMCLEDVAEHIRDAVAAEENRIDAYAASMDHVELRVIKNGQKIIWLKNGKPLKGTVIGFTKTILDRKLSHSTAVGDLYYIEYENGCSGSHPAEEVFLTIEEAKDYIFRGM